MEENNFITSVNIGIPPQVIDPSAINTIEQVISNMKLIDSSLLNIDGVKWFNLLYLKVTEGVRDRIADEHWEDAEWIKRLDVLFARLYFQAFVSAGENVDEVDKAWRPLFQSRRQQKIARIQFALAGMNAHINHDLAIAVVQTCEERNTTPRENSPQFRDFNKVNDILEQVEEEVKPILLQGIVEEVDGVMGRIDDIIAMWSVRKARQTAWDNAQILWNVRSIPLIEETVLRSISKLVSMVSKGLLTPTLF